MKGSSKNIDFNAKYIERYHAGQLSAGEMHALEKAALEDPFLADALEGYAYTSTATTDLEKIQSRLKEKTEKKKIIPFIKKYSWLKIAALFIIFTGSGWIIYQIAAPANKQNMAFEKADKKIEPIKTEPIKTNNSSADSSPLNNEVVQTDKKINDVPQKKIVKQSNKAKAKTNAQKDLAIKNKNQSEPVVVATVPTINKSNEINKRGLINNKDRSRDVSSNNKSMPDLSAKNNATAKQFNNNNEYSLDSNKNKDVALKKTDDLSKNDTLNIVLKPLPQQQQISEVVVTAMGTKKRKEFARPQVIVDTVEPAQGYTNFDDYVTANLKTPDELKIKPVSGEVQLLFEVNKNGEPVNITVVKSLCDKCDEEAVRLLKKGPKWKKKKNIKGKVTIRF